MHSLHPDQIQVSSCHYIGGRHVAGRGAALDVRRPSDNAVYAGLPVGDADLVDEAVQNAWTAFKTSNWATQAPRERARVMRRWADLIQADAGLAALEAVGSTRPIANVRGWDVPSTAEGIRFFAEFADKVGGDVAATRGDALGMTIAEPYGVIGAIAPWNFPLVMASWKIGPALAAGNALVRHPRIAKVTFTGSTRTGSAIMAACAQTGTKPVTLELGGKSPQMVFADAPDLDKVARMVAGAIAGNAGQVCVAGSRLIVQRQVADRLIDGIAAAFGALRAGHTWDGSTTLSPIISPADAQRIDGMVQRTVQAGRRAACGRRQAGAARAGGGHGMDQPLWAQRRFRAAHRRLQALRHGQGSGAPVVRGQPALQNRAGGFCALKRCAQRAALGQGAFCCTAQVQAPKRQQVVLSRVGKKHVSVL
jgi:aldehyde dehydrogenase (NAD+)